MQSHKSLARYGNCVGCTAAPPFCQRALHNLLWALLKQVCTWRNIVIENSDFLTCFTFQFFRLFRFFFFILEHNFQSPNFRAQLSEPSFQSPVSEHIFQNPDFRAQISEPGFQSPDFRAQISEPRFQSPQSRAQNSEPKFQSPNPRAQS